MIIKGNATRARTVPAWCISIRLFAAGSGTKRIRAQSLYRTAEEDHPATGAIRAKGENWSGPKSNGDDMAWFHAGSRVFPMKNQCLRPGAASFRRHLLRPRKPALRLDWEKILRPQISPQTARP